MKINHDEKLHKLTENELENVNGGMESNLPQPDELNKFMRHVLDTITEIVSNRNKKS